MPETFDYRRWEVLLDAELELAVDNYLNFLPNEQGWRVRQHAIGLLQREILEIAAAWRLAGFIAREMEWACAAAGELGEMCNLIKKRRRGEDVPVSEVMKEMADVIIYLDLLAARMRVHLSGPIRDKFNEVSERIGSDVFLRCEGDK